MVVITANGEDALVDVGRGGGGSGGSIYMVTDTLTGSGSSTSKVEWEIAVWWCVWGLEVEGE